MQTILSNRIQNVSRSFIREILGVALQLGMISFAGGLPSPLLFPTEAIRAASDQVLADSGAEVLQYASSEGDMDLREWISARYLKRQDLVIPADQILITSGSQQALDLLAKVLINEGDALGIEAPGYLGAIQAFSVYQPSFVSLPVDVDGMSVCVLQVALTQRQPKLIYTVSTFQNPSGGSYPEENKHAVAQTLRGLDTLLVDDDPYGELRFSGTPTTPFWKLLPEQTVLLGSFSKVVAPGLRLGWVAAPKRLIAPLLVAKQATDLHTSLLAQRLMYQYLQQNSLDAHIKKITTTYGRQCEVMLSAIKQYFPSEVNVNQPEGGLFLWVSLPQPLTAQAVFERAVEQSVVFVPGDPFYIDPQEIRTLRLNFSCVDEATIKDGIKRLGAVIRACLSEAGV